MQNYNIKVVDKSTKCAKILGLGQNKVSFDMFVKFLFLLQLSSRGVVVNVVDLCAEGPLSDPGRKHIFYLHSNSAAKKNKIKFG